MKFLFLTFLLIPVLAISGEGDREVTVLRVISITGDRPAHTKSKNVTRVYVNEAAWGSANCRQDAADLLIEDSHTYSMLLMAWASGKTIRIGVDDRRKPFDEVCKITYIEVE